MRSRSLGTIRGRLLLAFVLIVLVSVVGVSSLMVLLGARNAGRQVVAQLESVATLKEAEIESWVGGLRVNLDLVLSGDEFLEDVRTLQEPGASPEGVAAADERLRARFAWASERMVLFDELFLMDPEGRVLVSTRPASEREKHNIYEYFIRGLQGHYVQEPSYSLALQKLTVMASTPVQAPGEVLGVLAGRASLRGLSAIMLQRAGLGETGETYLVGSNRRLLTSLRDELRTPQEMYVSSAGVTRLLESREPGSSTYRNYRGDRVIGVYRWVPELEVGLVAEQGRSEALAGTALMLATVAGVALLALGLAMLAAVLITRTIARPVAELAQTATEIAGGDLGRRAPVRRRDEVGVLAEAFNTMADRLRELVGDLEQRSDQLRTINEVGCQISSILHLDDLLPYVAGCLRDRFDYREVAVLLVDPVSGTLSPRGVPPLLDGGASPPGVGRNGGPARALDEGWALAEAAAATGQVQIACRVAPGDCARPEGNGAPGLAELAVPIMVQERPVGVLHIRADRGQSFDELDLSTTRTLADQLAIAIQNSELYEQAQELATVQERQRLARDLHDAVSQTLFSTCLIAEVLPRLWERDPAEGRRRMEELRRLTKGALGEMRMLLLELRPATLEEARFDELLRHLTDAFICKAGVPAALEAQGDASLPAEVQVAFYRIAQEGLNNVYKHARANEVRVCCRLEPSRMELVIEDDGVGFDPAAVGGDHLGLAIMGERAAAVGAVLELRSEPGAGTTLTLGWERGAENEVRPETARPAV